MRKLFAGTILARPRDIEFVIFPCGWDPYIRREGATGDFVVRRPDGKLGRAKTREALREKMKADYPGTNFEWRDGDNPFGNR